MSRLLASCAFILTILTALPHRIQLRVDRLFEELNATLAAYVRAQLIACVVVGTLCGVGFALLGTPYAVLLGVLTAMPVAASPVIFEVGGTSSPRRLGIDRFGHGVDV